PVGNAVAVGVRGEDFNVLLEVAGKVRSILEKTPGVSDISLGYDFGKKQLRVRIDEQKARKYHLTVEQIATTIRNVVEGGLATSIKPSKAEEEINVLVRFPGEVRNRADVFQNIQIANRQGKLVPLLSVATVEETESIYQINHLDGKRVVMVAAEVDNKKATSMSVNQMLKRKLKDVAHQYLGTTIQYKGEFEEQQETLRNLLASFLLVLFFIFIILAREFNSLLLPFLIMVTIPFGFIGVVVTFLLHGRPLSFFAFMGMVGLAGVVVNSAIILVDFINSRRRNGLALLEALVEASQARLRPILMTTGTTIAGLVTVAYGIGGGDPFLKPMALAMMWGLFFAASLTLFAIPCFYHILEDFTQRFFKRPLVALEKE
ncbi:MAG: efflux RND transporter permease subunit, partial [Candidatus Omnitrophota bacterium]|nr:efflux RND transporter permease subunit [Candidatus Omnitrophota bacterium]